MPVVWISYAYLRKQPIDEIHKNEVPASADLNSCQNRPRAQVKSGVILFSSCNDEMWLNSDKTVFFAASIQQLQLQRVPVHAATNSPVVFLLK